MPAGNSDHSFLQGTLEDGLWSRYLPSVRLSQLSLNSAICVKFLRFVMLWKRIEVVMKNV
ncbi:MAG: hypothetical protein MJZ73_08835 [Bacteroidaceae bacterium]|nr:hypothetical protein [Bacteroidaceae bacterium]